MPAERPFNRYYRSMHGGLRPLAERTSPIDVTRYPQVRDYLKRTIPDFRARFGKYDEVFEKWHGVRIDISNLPLDGEFAIKAAKLRSDFMDYYEDPKSEYYVADPDFLIKLEPVLTSITNLVVKARR